MFTIAEFGATLTLQDAFSQAMKTSVASATSGAQSIQGAMSGASQSVAASAARMGDSMTGFSAQTKRSVSEAKSSLQEIGDYATRIAERMGIAFGIREIIEFGVGVVETAHQIEALSGQLGVGVDAVQRYKYVADLTGGSVDQFGSALFRLEAQIGGNAKAAMNAASQLGIPWAQLKAMKPEDQLDLIVSKLQGITNQSDRTTFEIALFGRGAGQSIGRLIDDYARLKDQAGVMSDATIKALADAEASWKKLGNALTIVTGQAIAAQTKWPAILKGAAQSPGTLLKFITDLAMGNVSGAVTTGVIGSVGPGGPAQDINLPAAGSKTPIDYVAQLKATQTALTSLSAATKTQIAAGIQLGDSDDDIAKGLSNVSKGFILSSDDVRLYREELKQAAQADSPLKNWTKDTTELATKIGNLSAAGFSLDDILQLYGKSAEKAVSDGVALGQSIDKIPAKVVNLAANQGFADIAASFTKLTNLADKFGKESYAALAKQQQALAEGTASAGAASAVALVGLRDNYQKTFTSIGQIQQSSAAQWKQSALVSIQGLAAVAPAYYQEAKTLIDQLYGHMTSAGALFGMQTQAQLQQDATDLKKAYDTMAASGNYTSEQLVTAWQRVKEAEAAAGSGVAAFQVAFQQTMSQIPSLLQQALQGGGGFAGAFKSLGASLGSDLGKGLTTSLGDTGSLLGGILTGGIGAAVGGLFSLISNLFSDHGRGQVTDFAASMGGFDQLHAQLNQLGADGQTLWVNLTQHTTDSQTATQNINAITTALSTHTQALATVTNAQQAYNQLMWSGTATAAQITDAYQALQDAQKAAGLATSDLMSDPLFRQSTTFANQVMGLLDPATLKQSATDMQDAYNDMVRAGTYTTQQLADAWVKVQTAKNAALGLDQFGVSTSFANVQSLMQKYGLTAANGSAAFQAQDVAEQSGQLGQDYASLTAGGIWGTSVAQSMQSQIQQVVSEALQSGGTIAGSLKEAIGVLVSEGGLTDLSGNALTNLSGLTFSSSSPSDTLADTQRSLDDVTTSAGDMSDAFNAKGGLNDQLVTATGLIDDMGAAFGSWPNIGIGPSGSGGFPQMSQPLTTVTSAGLAYVEPGDTWDGANLGMPTMTAGMAASSSRGDSGGGTAILQLDGRVLAEVVVPRSPRIQKLYKVNR